MDKIKSKYLILIFLLVAVIFSYVNQVSQLTEENYLIEKYQREIDYYSQESRSLEHQVLQDNSFSQVESLAQKLNFEETDKVSYIEVSGSEVVVK